MSDISTRRISSLNDDHDQLERAAGVLVEAFRIDPLLLPMVGGDLSLAQTLFRAFIAAAVVDGDAYFAEQQGEVIGVALWFRPGKEFLGSREQREAGWNTFWNELSAVGKEWHTTNYIPQYNALYSRSLPTPIVKENSYKLTSLGVLPEFQGKGVGSKLVREGQERARRLGAPLCVDTYTDIDVAIYQHWGFQVRGVDSMTSAWRDFVMTVMVWESR